MVDASLGTWGTRDCPKRRGPAKERKLLSTAYKGESHEAFPVSAMCQYEPLKVTVGDVVVFKVRAPESPCASERCGVSFSLFNGQ